MFFSRELLREIIYDDVIVEELWDGGHRWYNEYKVVFEYEGKHYETIICRGKTEQQEDTNLFEHDWGDHDIECPEVEYRQIVEVKHKWMPVKNKETVPERVKMVAYDRTGQLHCELARVAKKRVEDRFFCKGEDGEKVRNEVLKSLGVTPEEYERIIANWHGVVNKFSFDLFVYYCILFHQNVEMKPRDYRENRTDLVNTAVAMKLRGRF